MAPRNVVSTYLHRESNSSEAVNDAGSILAATGNTIEESFGILTAANTTLQNISKSATAVRTIAARLTQSTTELEALGEATDGLLATADLTERMAVYGVAITDANGNLLSTFQILQNISKVWANLETTEKSAIAEMVAGVRQQSAFFSLISNWSDAEQIVKDSANATGELQAAQEIWIDSITGKLKQLEASTQAFSQGLLDSEFVKSIIIGLTQVFNILEGIVSIGDGFLVTMPTIILSFTGLLALIKKIKTIQVFKDMATSLKLVSGLMLNAIKAGWAWVSTLVKTKKATEAATAANQAYNSTNPIGWMILVASIAYGIVKVISLWVKTSKELAIELQESKDELAEINQSLSTMSSELETIAKRIDELHNKGPLTLTEESELKRLKEESAELKYQIELEKIKQKPAQKKAAETLDKLMSKSGRLTTIEGVYFEELGNSLSELDDQYLEKIFNLVQNATGEARKSLSAYLSDKSGDFATSTADTQYYTGDNLEDWQIASNKWLDYVEEFNYRYMLLLGDTASANAVWDKIVSKEKWSAAIAALNKLSTSSDLSAESIRSLSYTDSSVKNLIDYLVKLGLLSWDNLDILAEQLKKDEEVVKDATKAFQSYIDILDAIQDKYDMISSALDDMDEYGILSADTVAKLFSDEYRDLTKYLQDNNLLKLTAKGYVLAENALESYIQKLRNDYLEAIRLATVGTAEYEEQLNNLARLDAVLATLGASKAIEQAKEALNNQKDALEEQLDAYQELIDLRKSLLQSYADELNYQKELAKKQKTVSDLETQLAVAKLDSSAAGRARARSLEKDLSKAKDELEEFTLEHAVDVLCNELDLQYQQYKLFIDAKVTAIIEAIENIKANNYNQYTNYGSNNGSDRYYDPSDPGSDNELGTGPEGPAHIPTQAEIDAARQAVKNRNGIPDVPVSGDTASTPTKSKADATADAQAYIYAHNMLDSDRGRWGQDPGFRALLEELTKAGGSINDLLGADKKTIPALTRPQISNKPANAQEYHSGGIVGGHFALKDNEEFAKLLQGEYVATPAQMKKFMRETLPAITSTGGSNEFNAPLITITCESVTKDSLPKLKDIVNEAVEEIKQQFDGGFSRTGRKNPVKKLQLG